MTSSRLILAGFAGLLVAAALIGGVSLYGGAAVHIDLLQGGSILAANHGPNAPAPNVVVASIASNSTVSSYTISAAATADAASVRSAEGTAGTSSPLPTGVSSIDTLTSESGPSLLLLLLPIAVGAVLGLVSYRLYAYRVDAG